MSGIAEGSGLEMRRTVFGYSDGGWWRIVLEYQNHEHCFWYTLLAVGLFVCISDQDLFCSFIHLSVFFNRFLPKSEIHNHPFRSSTLTAP